MQKNGTDEPIWRAAIETQTQKMDMWTQESGGWWWWSELGDEDWHTYTTMCNTASQWEAADWHRELSLVLCDYLEGWNGAEGSEREVQEKGDTCIVYVYIQLIHFTVQQKITQHCRAITLQLKKNPLAMIQDTNMIQNHSFCKHENFYNFVNFQNRVNNISTKSILNFFKKSNFIFYE